MRCLCQVSKLVLSRNKVKRRVRPFKRKKINVFVNLGLVLNFLRHFFKKFGRLIFILSVSANKKFQCPVCTKSFARHTNYTTHMKLHESGRRHFCSHCGRWYRTESELLKHQVSETYISVMDIRSISCNSNSDYLLLIAIDSSCFTC